MSDFSPNYDTPPRFYRHSGRAPISALLAGILAILPGILLGALWGYIQLYVHLAPGKIMFVGMIFGTLGFGYALGFLPTVTLLRFKARSPIVTTTFTLLSVTAGLYAAWVFFIYAIGIQQQDPIPLSYIASPVHLAQAIAAFYENGIWPIFDGHTFPKGIILALFWIAELFGVLTMALTTAIKKLNKRTFCETCNTWGTARPIMAIGDANWPELKKSLTAGHIDALAAVTSRSFATPSWCDVSIEGCPTCDNMQTLTVTRTVITPAKKGKASTKTKDLIRRLVLTPEQTVQIAVTAAGLKTPSPAPES